MTFKPGFAGGRFQIVSVDSFIKGFRSKNPQWDIQRLREELLHFRELKRKGVTCECGNPLWVIGSAISGKACFTCITGETDPSEDYEIG